MTLKLEDLKILGNILHVRVTPKASSNQLKIETQESGEKMIRVYVTCVPEGGKANNQVLKLLSKALKIPKSSMILQKGYKTRDKVICIEL
ncbi:MAG: DUF167 domain-containing protein [bacterium]|nr:DUF167 domain-containing protein [bacterium]